MSSVVMAAALLSVNVSLRSKADSHAVSRRLPITAARVRAQIRSCGICGGQSGTGAGFLRILILPLPVLLLSTASHSSASIIRGCYNRPVNGRRIKWNQSDPTPKKKKKLNLAGQMA
jgi:hypothetical protein